MTRTLRFVEDLLSSCAFTVFYLNLFMIILVNLATFLNPLTSLIVNNFKAPFSSVCANLTNSAEIRAMEQIVGFVVYFIIVAEVVFSFLSFYIGKPASISAFIGSL